MYFFMIRPQQKQRKEHQAMMSKLRPGDEVVTIGRLHGVVSEVNEEEKTVTLDCEGIYLTFDLVAIQRVVSAKSASQTATKTTNDQPEASKEDQASQATPEKEAAADDTATDDNDTDSAH